MAGSWLERMLDAVRGYGSRLNDYEMAIVEAVARELPPTAAERLLRRARAVNRVQRLMGGEDTTLYQMQSGRPVFPADTSILDAPGSVRFARVEARSAESTSRLRATLFLHEGNLSALEFDRPSTFAEAAKIEDLRVTLLGPPYVDPDSEEERTGWPAAGR